MAVRVQFVRIVYILLSPIIFSVPVSVRECKDDHFLIQGGMHTCSCFNTFSLCAYLALSVIVQGVHGLDA